MSIPFQGKPAKTNFANKKIQFDESQSNKSIFVPVTVFEYLTPEQVESTRKKGTTNNSLLPPARGGLYPKNRGSNLLSAWNTGPWRRLGEEVERVASTFVPGELTDLTVGGSRIGRVTIVGEEENNVSSQQNIEKYDGQRQGKNMQNFEQFSKTLMPIIRISPDSFFSYDNVFNHNYGSEYFGYGLEFKIFDDNFTVIPFQDFGKLVPKDLLGKTQVEGYPIVTDLVKTFEQFVNPSDPGFNGAIDVFHVRTSIIDSIYDYLPTGIKGEYMGASVERNQRGAVEILDVKEVKDKNQFVFYEDLQELEFGSFNFPSSSYNTSQASGYKFALPNMMNQNLSIANPYIDESYFSQQTENYSLFSDLSQKNNFLSGSDRNKSIIGERFKSSTCGLIFGESNILGTDSIAFGGLKK